MGLPETFTNDEDCDRTFVKQREMLEVTETAIPKLLHTVRLLVFN